MPKSTNYADNLFKLLDVNTAYASVGDAGGLQPSATPGSLYVSLHTGDPGLTGDQTVNEANYTGYGRVAVARSAAGWTVATNQVSNTANIVFGLCTATPNTITWFGVGTDAAGAGQLLYAFPLIQTYYAFHAEVTNNQFHQNSGLSTLDPIQFLSAPGDVLPAPVVQGTTYYVSTIVSPDLFKISTTSGGPVLNILADGFGLLGKIAALVVNPGVTPQFLAGSLILFEV